MSTISKCNIGGQDFYYEHIPLGDKVGGAKIFAIKDNADAKEFDLYWVVIPINHSEWDNGCPSPDKGHVLCMCNDIGNAKMIASSINIAHYISFKFKDLDKIIEREFKDFEDTYDTDAMSKEITRLQSEGKSNAEISKIMTSKHESFLRKKPTENKKDGGEW